MGAAAHFLVHDHPRHDTAIGTYFIGIDAAKLTFLASFNLALLLRRDIVVAAVDQVISERDHDWTSDLESAARA